ncbi:hypothetical protein LOZ07_003487 [Ophidiomyces ophidiicola]|nr:uncharacterized protein LOZ57_002298 [Ophidiomyces ophidiicola]KAI1949820.1 hypothetical protein LOZ57_002298 [Ophidiomyces ophidiicola]KAI2032343.1 hypothetical protein LOZ48_002471 [Ophidiomyces ophidiicola]KAI2050966.1 hypothetical protein LOZ38_003030 [Ophidiomyces ophidiicola]KAI2068869.1 hypothetical protein LOZ40_002601 [Ophidiomyces ophidiicola]KAI2092093.1 hypothetical protein LOZ35_004737 [Ophidiomyces ophidiicola]
MTDLSGFSDAHFLLLAVQLCTDGDISQLPDLLQRCRNPPSLEPVLRIILTFLPESVEPSRYIPVLNLLSNTTSNASEDLEIDTSAIADLSETEARKQVRRLRLLPLQYPGHPDELEAGPLTRFLIHRAYRIDNEFGVQTFLLDLLSPFCETSDLLRSWVISTILPLVRFNYEYHPDKDGIISLELLESLDCKSAVNTLLSSAESYENGGKVDQDLRGLVGPWIYGHNQAKRRKLHKDDQASSETGQEEGHSYQKDWQEVNEWLLSTSLRDFDLAAETVVRWAGPEDICLGPYKDASVAIPEKLKHELASNYGQAAFAAIYSLSECKTKAFEGVCRILTRISSLLEIDGYSTLQIHRDELLPILPHSIPDNIRRQNFSHTSLLQSTNPVTYPTPKSMSFLDSILASIRTLNSFSYSISPRQAAELCLFVDEESQLSELREVIEALKRDSKPTQDWRSVREQLLWLRNWGSEQGPATDGDSTESASGLFSRIPLSRFEEEILSSLLMAKQYSLALSIYTSASSPLSSKEVESTVTNAVFMSYDSASNGNKTRGGMKRAIEILDSFTPHFPESVPFQQIRSLLSATHAISFYSLTLQQGVPFQPVGIRLHQDPISLIEKILEQNSRAYTELDNLLKIGHQLIAAGLPNGIQENDLPDTDLSTLSLEQTQLISSRRIISLSVSSALNANDFETAYSYITTRLAHDANLFSSTNKTPTVEDNTSWRAAYTAGRHRSTAATHEPPSIQSRISRLSQQMELLSLALLLSPSPEPLPEILAVWRRSDEEMNTLQAQEQEEADSWDTHGDDLHKGMTSPSTAVPGGFGPSDAELDALDTQRARAKRLRRPAARRDYDEAPMGLFDVARGAARAISKNAFPLSRAPPASTSTSTSARRSMDAPAAAADNNGDGAPGDAAEEAGRAVRKRDMVSSMVTGGLASGLGWVLGAQPVNQNTSSGGGGGNTK